MYFKSKQKSECCACTACKHACPVNAIQLKPDEEGFLYPLIDLKKCIGCGLCEKICPVEHPDYSNEQQPSVYASILNNVNQRKKSTSGGVFYAIASWVINHGGKVYGATIDELHKVYHIGVETIEDLEKLRGSKYVQSDLKSVFLDIKEQLLLGRLCYFVGTGCQVAGLKAYLRKEFDKLITSDLVCHGVPSQWLFDQHVEYLENRHEGVLTNYRFRNNESGVGCEIFDITKSNGRVVRIKNPTYNLSPYLYSFMYSMTSRLSCYECAFAKIPRQGDVTLADFWGAKYLFPDFDLRHGISLVLLNTEKGRRIWDEIKSECIFCESKVDDAARYNGNLVSTTIKNPHRDVIYEKIRNEGYASIAKTYFKCPKYRRTWLIAHLETNRYFAHIISAMVKLKKYFTTKGKK